MEARSRRLTTGIIESFRGSRGSRLSTSLGAPVTPHRRPVLNRCRARGHLAAVRIPIPADPSRFSFWADAEKTPCSALACSGCGLPVRSFPGLLVVGGAEARAALHAQGPEGVAGVTRGMSDYRLYVCPCASYSCGDFVGLSVAEDHPELGLPPSWGCAGHPPLVWGPIILAGSDPEILAGSPPPSACSGLR